ncbi:MAG: hypothetical protein ABJE10_05405 [bacterium]
MSAEHVFTIVAACFDGLPENVTLSALALSGQRVVRIVFVNERPRTVRLSLANRPGAILFPPCDALGEPCAPLISQIRRVAPSVRATVLLRSGLGARGVVEAVRAGAEVHSWSVAADLRRIVRTLSSGVTFDRTEVDVIATLIGDLTPRACCAALSTSAELAHCRLSVADLAEELHSSVGALSRTLREARWPSPSEVIDWGRLLRASIVRWREEGSMIALVDASGFADARALHRSATRLLGASHSHASALTPLYVATMLRRRLKSCRA